MKKKIYFAVLLFVSLFSQSCKEETEPPVVIKEENPVVTCKEYDFGTCAWGAGYRPTGAEYLFPCFNPNNGNEFLYVKDVANARSIHKYNLLTKQSTLIADNVSPLHQPDWSRTGWIVFSDMSWKIWKVRDNGTGLQRISSGKNDQYPSFNPAGDKIIFPRSQNYTVNDLQLNPALNNEYKMLVIDLAGNPVDSICAARFGYCSPWGISSWAEPDRILRLTGTGQKYEGEFSYYNYQTRQDEPPLYTYKTQENGMLTNITAYKALSQTKIYYSSMARGLYEFDALANKHRLLKTNCHDASYNFFSISPDKTHLLVEKEVNTQVSKCGFDQKRSIVLMKIDGSNEQEIQLP